jgi:hypothetical protein
MSPSRGNYEACLSHLAAGEVISINILAGGYLDLDETAEHLRSLSRPSGFAIGVPSEQHAEDSFTKLRTTLGN